MTETPTPAPPAAPPRPKRATPRQATSVVAYSPAPEPDEDDPLLAFAPFIHPCPRRNSITPDKQRRFVATLAATGIVSQAARSIGKSLEALYKLRHRPGAEGFAAAWDAAVERGLARLEDCALELAIAGEELPIVSAGKLLGTYRKHNFGHIRFVLTQRRGARWNSESTHWANLVPGHPVYERLKRGWEAEQAKLAFVRGEEAIRGINAKLTQIVQRRQAAKEREEKEREENGD